MSTDLVAARGHKSEHQHEQRDQSVQFSLKELMKLEDERMAEQERDAHAREIAALEARADAERRERLALEAKERARAEEEASRQRAEIEDVARREAMQKAIVEQARLEVETRARASERERERLHEIELQQLRVQTAARGGGSSLLRTAASAAIGAALTMVFALGLHFGVTKPSNERQIAAVTQAMTSADQRADDADRRVAEQRRTIDGLEKSAADHQAEIVSLKKELATLKKTTTPPTPKPGVAGPRPRGPSGDNEPDCPPRDPMCFKIK